MPVCADNLRFFAGAARVLEGKSAGEYMRGYTSMIRREPIGIVGGIAPWNYPLMMAVWKLGPALAAGNVQVSSRPSRRRSRRCASPSSPATILPPGVLNVITGDGEPVGAGIVTPPGRAPGLADRRRRDGQGDRAHGRRHAQARPPRARRQGAGARLRRRRPGRGRRGDQDRRLLELRPGLHRRLARRRRAEDLRQAARRARARWSSRCTSATRPRATRSRWAR